MSTSSKGGGSKTGRRMIPGRRKLTDDVGSVEDANLASTPTVVVVSSTSTQQDAQILMEILPSRYQPEDQLDASIVSLSDGQGGMVVILPDAGSKGPPSSSSSPSQSPSRSFTSTAVILLREEDVDDLRHQLATQERSGNLQSPVEEIQFVETCMIKFTLPGGCRLTLAATGNETWRSSPEVRSKVIEFMVAPESKTTDENGGGGGGFLTPKPQKVSILNGAAGNESVSSASALASLASGSMRRTLSMPSLVPPMVTTSPRSGRMASPYNKIFPSLRTQVLSTDGRYLPFKLNSQTPIPVETELFVGQLLLIIRPPKNPQEDDPYWNERIFSKKKRRVVMQLQGKLKYKPTGTLYTGMEISDPMNLGLIAAGLCNIILKMTKSFNQELHYSFGDKEEQAHICFPASTFFEQLIVTKPGEEPPTMGEEFVESDELAKSRKAYKTKIDWNTDDTYSMSFHSMYIDFPSWSVVRLPVGRDIGLQTFWGNSIASVVLYEADPSKKRHSMSTNRYLLGVSLKYLGKESELATLEEEEDRISDSDTDWSEENFIEIDIGATAPAGEGATGMPALNEEQEADDNELLEFFDTVESQSMFPDAAIADVSAKIASTSPHNTVLRVIDDFCPCWIDVMMKRGKYATAYGFSGRQRPDRLLLRTVDMAVEVFGKRQKIEVDDRFSPRMSEEEQTRRVLGLKYAEAHLGRGDKSRLNKFDRVMTHFDSKFLKRIEPTSTKVHGIKAGFVARALSDRHWIEERMVLRDGEVLFHHVERSKINFKVSLCSVVGVSIPNIDGVPLIPSCYFLTLEDFGRVIYLMFISKKERDSWLDILSDLMSTQNPVEMTRSFTNHLIDVDDPMHEFLHKSSMWDCQKRRIINCRRYSFRAPIENEQLDSMQVAERALTKVLSLQPKVPNDADLRDFLDCAAALKEADAYSLTEDERVAFFLNVYHTMIMHAYIVLGPPDSSLKLINYFNNIAYQCSDDVFSLSELEHNIIRANMSYPSQFLSRFILPKSQFAFSLSRPDFRINFALRSGSKSEPTLGVPLYRAQTLNAQLDRVTREMIDKTVSIKSKNGGRDVFIILPRICQWFAEDFGPNGSASDVLIAIGPFINSEEENALRSIWNGKRQQYEIGLFNLKYLPYSFECHFLTLQKEE